jgi:large subunit ribosomal protein L20
LTRVKGGPRARQRHKKVLKLTKGQRGTKHSLYRRAHEAMLKSLTYQYTDRRRRKRDFRRLWIARINAAARQHGMPYGRFMAGLRQAGVQLDRKALAELAVSDGQTFARLVEMAKTVQ